MPKHCKARRHGDQMICVPCGLQWDVNDTDRPECNRGHHVAVPRNGAQSLPVQLPDELAADMVRAYHANAREGLVGQMAGMQYAYRVFLDRVGA